MSTFEIHEWPIPAQPLGLGSSEGLGLVVEALQDFVFATSEIRRWAQSHFDGRPDFRCSGPWPKPHLIENECNRLRAAYLKHADTLALISEPQCLDPLVGGAKAEKGKIGQDKIDSLELELTDTLRALGLTWKQTNSVISLVQKARAEERERCAEAFRALAGSNRQSLLSS